MDVFGSGPRLAPPQGDVARQAVAALRGYGYQLYASGLAWLGLADGEVLHLEVAEDYAVTSRDALLGTQVKDTARSGTVTLQSADVRATLDSYVDLLTRNPGRTVSVNYLTTAAIGRERRKSQRVGGDAALHYWRRAAAGADVSPLRAVLEDLSLKEATKAHIASLSDERLRREFLSRIHWLCGAPKLDGVRADLEAGLVELVASTRRLSSQVGKAMLPVVLERLLMTVASDGPRQLRRADLLSSIDDVAMVAVPREQLAEAFLGTTASTSFSRPSLLVPVADFPLPTILAKRASLVTSIDQERRANGFALVSGATGLGKSLTARLVATQTGDPWAIVDFRNLSVVDTAARLSVLLGELAASPVVSVILDDLNEIDDPTVSDILLRVIAALRRRDCTAIATTYIKPTLTTLHKLSIDSSASIDATYFDIDEVSELITTAGGDAKYTGAFYHATSNGHPQLVIAALLHLSATDWSRRSMAAVLGGQSRTSLEAERRAARQRLVAAMPTEAQTLLFRLSVIEGAYDRNLAMALGRISPPVPLPGAVLDKLFGPWIEPMGRSRLRTSPLLEGAGADVFSIDECRAIHHCIADTLLRDKKLSALDAEMIFRHALHSEDSGLIVGFAHSIVASDVETLEILAPFVGTLQQFGCDEPIFPPDPAVAAVLRLAQLLALLPQGSMTAVQDCWAALERERTHLVGETLFEGAALSKLLLHPRTGELFSDWLELLLRLDRLTQADKLLSETNDKVQSKAPGNPHLSGVLLANQMRSIRRVSDFRRIIERLNDENSDVRGRLFSSFGSGRGDIAILVNHGWLREAQTEGFDWESAGADYGICANFAIGWNNTALAVRCAVAEAICYDEYGKDPDRALDTLSTAEQRFGFDMVLVRARAKVHWRQRNFAAALPLLTAVAEEGGQDRIERVYIEREAAISAAELGDWSAAEGWFDRAQATAAGVDLPAVQAMAIGLLADTAHAAYHAGHPHAAVEKLRDALVTLPTIDPEGTLAEAHCHRVVRHAVLWLFNEVTGCASTEDGTIPYAPGCASNPDPVEAIRSHPLAALDTAFYLLADADEEMSPPSGFCHEFRNYLIDGPVLSQEISRAIAEDQKAIRSHDASAFSQRVRRHASMAEMISSGKARELASNLLNPTRGRIQLAVLDLDSSVELVSAAEDFILSFGIAAAIAGNFQAVDAAINECLDAPELTILHPLLQRMQGNILGLSSDREGTALSIYALRRELTTRPAEFCWTCIWMLLHLRNSRLRSVIAKPFLAWLFGGWTWLAHNARFRLSMPSVTVPPLEAALAEGNQTLSSAARVLLIAAAAASTTLPPTVRNRLEEVATSNL